MTLSNIEHPFIIIIADGWTKSVFLDLLDSGQLPELDDLLVQPGILLKNVVSIVPSVSIASHAAILTGEHQSAHRIPGHRWLDDSRHPRNYVGPGVRNVNNDLAPSVRTIYEASDSNVYAVQSIIRRGATRAHTLATMKSGPLIQRAVSILQSQQGSSVVLWLPRGDALAHRFGPDAMETRQDMIDTSRAFGSYLRLLGTQLDDYRILFVPDHGHRAVHEKVDLRPRLAALGLSHVTQNPIRGSIHPLATVIMSSGDSACYIYLPKPTVFEHVFDIARKLAREPSIEIIVSHESAFSANYFGKCGMARANLVNGSDLQYTVIAGDDPLGIVDRAVSSTVTFHSFQDHSPDLSQRYPDILRQTFESWVEGRSGDMLIMASSGYHFGTSPRMAWRLGNHRGSHGGPLREEVTVAAIARGMNSSIDPDAPVHSSDLVERLMSPHLQLDSGRRVAGSLIPQEMTGQDDTSGIDDDVESHFGSVDQI